MSKSIIVKAATGSHVITEMVKELSQQPQGNYFCNFPSVGFIRARKTTQISFQIYGTGITRPKLQKELAKITTGVEFELFPGEYNLEMIDTLVGNPAMFTDEVKEIQSEESITETEPEEKSFSVGKKDLDRKYKKKQIKNALIATGMYKKPAVKKIIENITFDGKNATGYDVLDGVDAANGKAPTSGESEAIFAELNK